MAGVGLLIVYWGTSLRVNTFSRGILRSDVLGSFDFQTLLISLDSLASGQLAGVEKLFGDGSVLDLESFEKLGRVFPLAAHEGTHFIDATSTLWGMRHLDMMNSAHSALKSGQEENFWKGKLFYDHLRSIKLPDYYTVVVPRPAVRPWKYAPSVGRIFDHAGHVGGGRPVFFCQFVDQHESLLARSPLSSVSVLEASAMAQELFMRLRLLARLPEPERRVEWRLWERELVAQMYNHSLTEYSVCAHLVANRQDCQDVIAVFRVTAILTRVCLNFPLTGYEFLVKNQKFPGLLGWGAGSEEALRLSQALSICDMGALYFLLNQLLPAGAYVDTRSLMDGLGTVASVLDLDWDDIWLQCESEADALRSRLAISDLQTLRIVGASGYRNFCCSALLTVEIPFEELHLPPMYFNDDVFVHVLGAEGGLEEMNPEEAFDELQPLASQVQSFGLACL